MVSENSYVLQKQNLVTNSPLLLVLCNLLSRNSLEKLRKLHIFVNFSHSETYQLYKNKSD